MYYVLMVTFVINVMRFTFIWVQLLLFSVHLKYLCTNVGVLSHAAKMLDMKVMHKCKVN